VYSVIIRIINDKINRNMKKGIVIGVMVLALGFSQAMPARAQDTASDLQALITSLMEQVKVLQEQIKSLNTEVKAVRAELQLTRSLYRGVSGDDVAQLQEFLKGDNDIYPEGIVSGYYGLLTEKAIKKFQKKYGIEQVGVVGPKTTSKLYELLEHGAGKSGKVPPGLLIAPGIAKKLSLATTTLSYDDDSDDRDCEKKERKHKEKKNKKGHNDGDDDDDEGDDDDDEDNDNDCDNDDDDNDDNNDDTATTTPPVVDITAPVISSVGISNITATSSLASWLTDEASDSNLWYATTTPIDTITSLQVSSTVLELSHGLALDGLTASTTYYFLVSSSDAVGNTATSTEWSFETLEQ